MRGRKNVYDTKIKPRFDDIKKWLETGATEKEVYQRLGVSKDSFYKFKKERNEFSDLLKKSRKIPVEDIKAAMFKRAIGFQYEEVKTTTQKITYEDGGVIVPAKLIKTEVTKKTALPDVAASLVLLQHWDKNDDGSVKWSRDPASNELKKKEIELKERSMEEGAW